MMKNKTQFGLLAAAQTLFLTYSYLGHVPVFKEILKIGVFIAIVLLAFNFLLQYEKTSVNVTLFYIAIFQA